MFWRPLPCSFHPEQADIVKEFDQSMGLDVTVGGDGDMDDDELVVVGGDIQKNTVCPYTGRNVRISHSTDIETNQGLAALAFHQLPAHVCCMSCGATSHYACGLFSLVPFPPYAPGQLR